MTVEWPQLPDGVTSVKVTDVTEVAWEAEQMNPAEHLAEAERLLARADTFDDSDRADEPRRPGDYSLERRTADVLAAHAHATIADLNARGFGPWYWTGVSWIKRRAD